MFLSTLITVSFPSNPRSIDGGLAVQDFGFRKKEEKLLSQCVSESMDGRKRPSWSSKDDPLGLCQNMSGAVHEHESACLREDLQYLLFTRSRLSQCSSSSSASHLIASHGTTVLYCTRIPIPLHPIPHRYHNFLQSSGHAHEHEQIHRGMFNLLANCKRYSATKAEAAAALTGDTGLSGHLGHLISSHHHRSLRKHRVTLLLSES